MLEATVTYQPELVEVLPQVLNLWCIARLPVEEDELENAA